MAGRFHDLKFSRHYRYALGEFAGGIDGVGVDRGLPGPYLSIPVSNRLVDYQEYYRLDPAEYAAFLTREAAAVDFANACCRREHDDRLIYQPGTDRGSSIEVPWIGPVPNPAH